MFIDNYSTVVKTQPSGVNAPSGQTQTIEIDEPTPISEIEPNASGYKLIASGTIKAGTTATFHQIDTYTLKMFVNDTVRISNTNKTVKMEGATNEISAIKYCSTDREMSNGNYVKGCKLYDDDGVIDGVATSTDGINAHNYLSTYSNLYYSVKLKVKGGI